MFRLPLAAAARSAPRLLARSYSKEVSFGTAGREKILSGVNQLTSAVAVTMGPKVNEDVTAKQGADVVGHRDAMC